jgi:hypothetical protein
MGLNMTDTTFESLIKAAADAQAAREGEAYKTAQTELGQIDTDILAKQLRRDQVVTILEAFDTAIENTANAVKRYVRAQDLDTTHIPPADPHDVFDAPQVHAQHNGQWPADADGDQDENSTARDSGALS